MCGRIFCLFESTEELLAAINEELSGVCIGTDLKSSAIYPRYNVAPATSIPVISGARKLDLLPWGFKIGPISVINARNEDIETKRAFRSLIDSERCVIACSGYYEWDQKTPKSHKPYSFRIKGHRVCFLAGLRNPGTDSVVLVTREAVESVSRIHTRMPVILRPEHIEKWLDNSSRTWESLTLSIIGDETYAGAIEFEAVDPIVNDAKNESPLCLQSFAEYRKEGQKSFFNKTAMIRDFVVFVLVLAGGAFSAPSRLPKCNPPPITLPVWPECSFPLLADRLLRMINYDEPLAFEIILHSECRGEIDTSHPNYIEIFQYILNLAQYRDMAPYLDLIMRKNAYGPAMFLAWIAHRPLLSLKYLEILRARFNHPDGSMIFSLSREYPQTNCPEREFLNVWLVELQRPTLKWPFTPEISGNHLKSKALKSSPISWSQFQDVPGISASEEPNSGTIQETTPQPSIGPAALSPPPPAALNFGHIYGWVSRKGNAIVGNSNKAFNFYGHTVKLHDTFLGFASSKFNLEAYAESAQKSKSFFVKRNSALSQQIRTKSGKNFAACRLRSGPDGGHELQAIMKGDLTLVVLGAPPSGGGYDYKYPDSSRTYDELLHGPKELRTITVPISASDVVLFLPRTIFNGPDLFFHPHEIPGIFLFTDLLTFPDSFVQFINFVHLKTKQNGLLAVGGFVHLAE